MEKGFVLRGLGAKINKDDQSKINGLLKQLSKRAGKLNDKEFEDVLSQPNFHIVVVRDLLKGEILGMACVCFYKTFSAKRGKGIVEDVVVSKNCRGLGIGRILMEDLIRLAAVKFCSRLELTSNSKRKEANELYIKLNFKKRETNCYRRKITRKDRPY